MNILYLSHTLQRIDMREVAPSNKLKPGFDSPCKPGVPDVAGIWLLRRALKVRDGSRFGTIQPSEREEVTLEEYNQREFQDVVLSAGYELRESHGHEGFDENALEQVLIQARMQNIPEGSVRQACEELKQAELFEEAGYKTFSITSASAVH